MAVGLKKGELYEMTTSLVEGMVGATEIPWLSDVEYKPIKFRNVQRVKNIKGVKEAKTVRGRGGLSKNVKVDQIG